jgi:hypothetical protein
MEYEISDEERLFDDSTNPSLKYESLRVFKKQPADKRALQVAVDIPEEEHQLS